MFHAPTQPGLQGPQSPYKVRLSLLGLQELTVTSTQIKAQPWDTKPMEPE